VEVLYKKMTVAIVPFSSKVNLNDLINLIYQLINLYFA